MKEKISEVELLKPVIRWLHDMKWEVYQEVSTGYGCARADIVAVNGPVLWVIEGKQTFSLALIEQAYQWHPFANLISVAVPEPAKFNGYYFAKKVLEQFGIGQFEVCRRGTDLQIRVGQEPRLNRQALTKHIRESLSEGHKSFAEAGNSQGQFWSPFQSTCVDIQKCVKENPGITLKALLEKIDTHYSNMDSARGTLSHLLRQGVIQKVRIEFKGRKIHLYPAEEVPKDLKRMKNFAIRKALKSAEDSIVAIRCSTDGALSEAEYQRESELTAEIKKYRAELIRRGEEV